MPIQSSGVRLGTSTSSAELYVGGCIGPDQQQQSNESEAASASTKEKGLENDEKEREESDTGVWNYNIHVRGALTNNIASVLQDGSFVGSGAVGVSIAHVSTIYSSRDFNQSNEVIKTHMTWWGVTVNAAGLNGKRFRDTIGIETETSSIITPTIQAFIGGSKLGRFMYGAAATLVMNESNLPSMKPRSRVQDRVLRMDSVSVVERREESARTGNVTTWNALEFACDGLWAPFASLSSIYMHAGLRITSAESRSMVATGLVGLYVMKDGNNPLHPGALIGLSLEFTNVDYYSLQPVNGPRISVMTIIPFS